MCYAALLTLSAVCCSCSSFLCMQLFDGKDGREKYPKRWVMFPPLL
jgi:hypothetical protein